VRGVRWGREGKREQIASDRRIETRSANIETCPFVRFSVNLEASLLPPRASSQRWTLRGWFLAVRSLPRRYWPVQRAMTCCGSSCPTSTRNAAARAPRTIVTARLRWEMDTEPSARIV
jgi:hypothetical protein